MTGPPPARQPADGPSPLARLGVVAIGRNEGERLERCLASIPAGVATVVYVDSGSSDGSVAHARSLGAEVVELDPSLPFSAARARNAGFARLLERRPDLPFVQFVDGDCSFADGWLERAVTLLAADPGRASVCGRRRERHPETSAFNRICDMEWRSAPAGPRASFGGDVAIRCDALRAAGGWNADVIAAEDDELGVRLRRTGGETLRVDEPMTVHDAAITRLSQWWRRAIRCGHGYAQVGALHAQPERYFRRERLRAWLWGGFLPAAGLLLAWPTGGVSLALLLGLYAVQALRVARGARRDGASARVAWEWALSCAASQPANLLGMLEYRRRVKTASAPSIIEYKGPEARSTGSAGGGAHG